MKFGPRPVAESVGLVLGHNVVDGQGRRVLRKGRVLSVDDVDLLLELGRVEVYVAELEEDDIDENDAADRIARRHARGVRFSGPATGRVNLHAEQLCVLRVDAERLLELNRCTGVTLGTLADWSVADPDRMVGTIKILPYALAPEIVDRALHIEAPVLETVPLLSRSVHLIVAADSVSQQRTVDSFERAIDQRLHRLGSRLDAVTAVGGAQADSREGERALADALSEAVASGAELVVLAGETAIQDRADVAPRAIEDAGGEVTCFGAPVDPGNLLLLAKLDGVPILGAPGCARSPKRNIIDLMLPRLLIGHHPSLEEVLLLGHGGLLEDVGERPLPRRQIVSEG